MSEVDYMVHGQKMLNTPVLEFEMVFYAEATCQTKLKIQSALSK